MGEDAGSVRGIAPEVDYATEEIRAVVERAENDEIDDSLVHYTSVRFFF